MRTALPVALSAVALGAALTAAAPALGAAPLTPAVATPSITVLARSGPLAPGYLFTGPKIEGTVPEGAVVGPEIADNSGRAVWFKQLPAGVSATDVREQTLFGRPVLTYWQGRSLSGPGHGEGVDYVLDQHYRVIARIRAGAGYAADQHEFLLTDRGTALITVYKEQYTDATSVGGPKRQRVLAGIVQEIDVRTGRVLFTWNSLDHVPVAQSHQPLPASPDTPWDYFHINAVRPDTDGNLIVNARHTWAFYKVDRTTGAVLWTLGGKNSTFSLGRGVEFAWQHDPEPVGDDTYRIFDNASNGVPFRPNTRIITVHADVQHHTATLVNSLTHPGGLSAPSQGNSQALPNGDLLVGWGQTGRISEFSPGGQLLFDATVDTADGYDIYRAYRAPWHGEPLTRPTLAVGDGQVDAIWNGATDVATWQVLGGDSRGHLTPVRAADWDGLDTPIAVSDAPTYLQVVAYDDYGQELGRSAVVGG